MFVSFADTFLPKRYFMMSDSFAGIFLPRGGSCLSAFLRPFCQEEVCACQLSRGLSSEERFMSVSFPEACLPRPHTLIDLPKIFASIDLPEIVAYIELPKILAFIDLRPCTLIDLFKNDDLIDISRPHDLRPYDLIDHSD